LIATAGSKAMGDQIWNGTGQTDPLRFRRFKLQTLEIKNSST